MVKHMKETRKTARLLSQVVTKLHNSEPVYLRLVVVQSVF